MPQVGSLECRRSSRKLCADMRLSSAVKCRDREQSGGMVARVERESCVKGVPERLEDGPRAKFLKRSPRLWSRQEFSEEGTQISANAWARGGRQQLSSIYFTSVNVQAT